MLKFACFVVLLVSTFGLAQASKPFPSPKIVATGKVLNQTEQIPIKTIFTSPQTGLYRLSVYATLVKADPNSQANWCFSPLWTDDSGTISWQTSIFLCAAGNSIGPFQFEGSNTLGGAALVFEAKAGTLITYSVTQTGPPDSSAYSLYYTVERLK